MMRFIPLGRLEQAEADRSALMARLATAQNRIAALEALLSTSGVEHEISYRQMVRAEKSEACLSRVVAIKAALGYALDDLVHAADAKRKLDSGFQGMGANILTKDAGRLSYAILRARKALAAARREP
jgi:hypothetical protein